MRFSFKSALKGSLLGLALCASAGCTRGGAGLPRPEPGWLEGILPASMAEGRPVDGGELVVRLPVEPPSLNPIVDSDFWMRRVAQNLVLETLMRLDPKDDPRYQLVPALAESVEESVDHLSFTFQLRRGVKWHDGKPFSAADVAATFERMMDPKGRGASLRSLFTDLDRFAAVDEATFRVSFKRPYFLALRQICSVPILPKHLLDGGRDLLSRHPVGTGPFRFAGWDSGRRIQLARNEAYWGEKAHLDRITFRVVTDPAVAMQLLERGEIDLMTAIPPAAWADMPKSERAVRDYHRSRFFGNNYSWIGWNEQRPFFADRRVRQAMTYLFDQDLFMKQVLLGLELPATCHFYFRGPDCDPRLRPYPYDPEKGKALLREAGWADHDGDGVLDKDGRPFRFTFLMPASSEMLGRLAPYLKEEYRKAGIEMEIARTEWALFVRRLVDHDFDAASLMWGDADVDIDPYQVWHSSQAQGGANYIAFKNPAADALIAAARQELEPSKRAKTFWELGRILYEEQPYTWMGVRPELEAIHKRVRGISASLAWYPLERAWIDPALRAGPRE